MAFRSKLRGLVRGHVCRNTLSAGNAPTMPMFNAMRCMATKLFVGGLSYGIDDHLLREAFSSYEEVTEARVITKREMGRSRGFRFVSYTTDESANQAVTGMDGQELDGRSIRVNVANERPPQGDGGGRGGYGGGGGGYLEIGLGLNGPILFPESILV